MSAKITDAERIERYKKLGLSPEEEQELLEYDKAVEHDERTEYDLSPEQLKIARKFAHTGTREVKKKPMVLNLPKKTRKENATKAGIVAELAEFLTSGSQFETSDIQITNKEREILLKICGEWYSVTLTYKRNMNK